MKKKIIKLPQDLCNLQNVTTYLTFLSILEALHQQKAAKKLNKKVNLQKKYINKKYTFSACQTYSTACWFWYAFDGIHHSQEGNHDSNRYFRKVMCKIWQLGVCLSHQGGDQRKWFWRMGPSQKDSPPSLLPPPLPTSFGVTWLGYFVIIFPLQWYCNWKIQII